MYEHTYQSYIHPIRIPPASGHLPTYNGARLQDLLMFLGESQLDQHLCLIEIVNALMNGEHIHGETTLIWIVKSYGWGDRLNFLLSDDFIRHWIQFWLLFVSMVDFESRILRQGQDIHVRRICGWEDHTTGDNTAPSISWSSNYWYRQSYMYTQYCYPHLRKCQ